MVKPAAAVTPANKPIVFEDRGILPSHVCTPSWALGVFRTYAYNHARRLRLEKLLHLELELSKSSGGYFKLLLGPCEGGDSASETAALRLQKRN